MTYAQKTGVSVSKSMDEIRMMVAKAGGTKFATAEEDGCARVLFELQDRRVMFELALPSVNSFAARKRYGRVVKADSAWQMGEWEQACRVQWRALALAIKAKLVSVESWVESFEEAFLAHIVVRDGSGKTQRFAEIATRAIADSYLKGRLPPLLGSGG